MRIKRFTRQKLAELFGELGFTKGAEVGVAAGNYSLVLCQNVPNLSLLCVDPYFEYYRATTLLKTAEQQERLLAEAKEKLSPYNVRFIRKPSVEAAKDVEDNSLDFVYIDGDHNFDYVMQDLIVWNRKVRLGGIVSGHDYYRFRDAGVVNAVDAFTTAHQVHEYFIDDERETSFFWVKR